MPDSEHDDPMRGVRLLIVTDEPVSGSRVPTGEQIISVNPA
jgi:hypothetical protein